MTRLINILTGYKSFDNYKIWRHWEIFITSLKRRSTSLSSQLLTFWKIVVVAPISKHYWQRPITQITNQADVDILKDFKNASTHHVSFVFSWMVWKIEPTPVNYLGKKKKKKKKHKKKKKKKSCFYCNMSGKNGSVGRDFFYLFILFYFFYPNNWNAYIGCHYASPAYLFLKIWKKKFTVGVLERVGRVTVNTTLNLTHVDHKIAVLILMASHWSSQYPVILLVDFHFIFIDYVTIMTANSYRALEAFSITIRSSSIDIVKKWRHIFKIKY